MEHTNNSYAKRTKIFGIITFIFIMLSLVFLLPVVYATTTVTLNSPTDNYLSPIPTVTFNCSFNSDNYINNFSFWTNFTGVNQIITYSNTSNVFSNSFGNGTTLNSTYYEQYTLPCARYNGWISGINYLPFPTYILSSGSSGATQSCGGGYSGLGFGTRTINLNDRNDYNIKFRFNSTSSASPGAGYHAFFTITNTTYSEWTNIFSSSFCADGQGAGSTIIYRKDAPNSFTDTNYTLTIINGNATLYNNSGILYSSPITYTGNWYLTIETWDGAGSDCGHGSSASTTAYLYNVSVTSLGRKNSTETFSQIFDRFNNNPFKWNCNSLEAGGISTFAALNRTAMVVNSAPIINITYPYGQITFAFVGQNFTFNWTISTTGTLNNCWFNYNGVNTTVPCYQNYSSFILAEPKTLTFYANDTANNIGSFTRDWNYSTVEHSVTYNNISYETANENFVLNVTSDIINSAYFIYNNGQPISSTINNFTGFNIVSSNLDIALLNPSVTTNYTFFWVLNTASGQYNTTASHIQTVNPINLYYCTNFTSNSPYINYSYFDEVFPSFRVNCSIPLATFNYWLGNGSVYKTFFYSTPFLGPELQNHAYCFTPSNRLLNLNYIYQATSNGIPGNTSNYITRTFNSIINITTSNVTTQEVLWMIQSADSGPVTIQVLDLTSGNVVPNARVTITRLINGVVTVIFDGYTDSAGTVGNYLSSITSYTITAQKPGCGSNTQTITPVGSYSIQLNCAGNLTKYSSEINGITYQRTPADGVSTPGPVTYGYAISSTISPMVSVMFELDDFNTGAVLATNLTDVSSGYPWCNSTYCLLTLNLTVGSGDNVKGKYYVNLGNATNYTWILLEGDAYWKYIFINTNNSQQAWQKTIVSFKDFMNVWGSSSGANCVIYQTNDSCTAVPSCRWLNQTEYDPRPPNYTRVVSFCILKDDVNKMEFSRILMIFFGMVVVLFILGKGVGYELTNPGSFVMFLTASIVILSMGGLFTFQGLTPWDWFNQYIYAYICVVFSAGYNLAIIRRYSA